MFRIPRNQRKVLRKRTSFIEPEATQISSEVDSESNGAERPSISRINTKIKQASQLTVNTGIILKKSMFLITIH